MNFEPIEVVGESFWLDNLRDGHNHVTLRDFLATHDKAEREFAKETILAHAKELLHMYNVPGRPKPMFPEPWHGKYGLYWHAKARRAWLETSESIRQECSEATDKANSLSWRASREARDWREAKALEQEGRYWRNRGYDLAREIYGQHYQTPACLI